MELLQLRYFCALARNQHLTRTAEELMISPPSLSATIAKLEQDLGVTLFDRRGRSIRLNRFGEAFYSHAALVLEELENARQELIDLGREERYTVHVGIGSLPIWKTALDRFQEQHPNILVDYFFLSPFDLERLGADARLDFYLGVSRDISADKFQVLEVWKPETPMVVISRRHPLATAHSLKLSQLRDEAFLSLGKSNPSAHKYILDMCSAAGFTPRKIVECDYFFRLKMILDNRGVALTSDLGARYVYSDPSQVKSIPITDPIITRTQAIVWRKGHYLSKGALSFRDFLAQCHFQDL